VAWETGRKINKPINKVNMNKQARFMF